MPIDRAIDRRDAILQAVATTGELLLDQRPLAARATAVLAALGAATGVDRSYVFRVDDRDGCLFATQLWEWAAPGVEPQIDNPDLQDVPFDLAGFTRWGEVLGVGGTVHGVVADFPDSEQELLRAQQIEALAVVPITVEHGWWGFAGFDLGQRRPFTDAEVAALRTAAGMLGAAMSQERLVQRLRDSRRGYVKAFRSEREAAQRLRDLDRMRTTFLDAVSHELRTPLTAVLGLGSTMLERFAELTDDEHRMLLERLVANADRLDGVLQPLLLLSRLRHGEERVEVRDVELAPFLQDVLAAFPLTDERDIDVTTVGTSARFDPRIGEHVLHDLLDNAVVHTEPGNRVWVTARGTEGGVHLTVEDDGPGVRGDRADETFAPFGHGTDLPPDAPGTGIGLSLVLGLAQLHEGHAWHEDRLGGGSTFHVLLTTPAEGDPTGA